MTSLTPITDKSLYEKDFYLWLSSTAELLKEQRFQEIDLENLIEEIESMARSERRALISFLKRLLEHLLKVVYWETERRNNLNHWLDEIDAFRSQLKEILQDSPSLKSYFSQCIPSTYEDIAKRMKTRYKLDVPLECPFTEEQILEITWYPVAIDDRSDL